MYNNYTNNATVWCCTGLNLLPLANHSQLAMLRVIRNWKVMPLDTRVLHNPDEVTGKAGGWLRARGEPSLVESFRSIAVNPNATPFRKLLTFMGPGYLVAVGYMDPGNWATSLAGGAQLLNTLMMFHCRHGHYSYYKLSQTSAGMTCDKGKLSASSPQVS